MYEVGFRAARMFLLQCFGKPALRFLEIRFPWPRAGNRDRVGQPAHIPAARHPGPRLLSQMCVPVLAGLCRKP
jgi:hypothetical protein